MFGAALLAIVIGSIIVAVAMFFVKLKTKREVARYTNSDNDISEISVFKKLVMASIVYPRVALEKKLQGNIIVSFRIDENGKIQNVQIVKGLHPECDKAVLEAINRNRNSFSWKKQHSSLNNSKPQEEIMMIPFHYKNATEK
ncbi:MAG: energy transducer TonB [Raineya sp.]|nr:energy transducer TonB [Raineya sp.]